MKKINSTLEEFVKKNEERREYMKKYMKAARKKGYQDTLHYDPTAK